MFGNIGIQSLLNEVYRNQPVWSEIKGDPLDKANWTNNEDEVIMSLDLPGYAKEEVKVSHSNSVFTISAENEVRGKYKESWKTNIDLNLSQSSAKFENGVLTLTIPRGSVGHKQIEVK